MLDIAVIIPKLGKYGGAEKYVIECVARWQKHHKITIYTSECDPGLLKEHGIKKISVVKISGYFEGEHSVVLNGALLPKIWEQEIGVHDVYNVHLWPTHLINVHPMVWFPHEPLRMLYDLKYREVLNDARGRNAKDFHIYPKYNYDKVPNSIHQAYLDSLTMIDKLGNPDRTVANSRYTAQYLENVYGQKVSDVVYPGVNLDSFITTPIDRGPLKHEAMSMPFAVNCSSAAEQNNGAPIAKSVASLTGAGNCVSLPDENIILSIGQLWPHKRIDKIIEAIKLVEDVQLYLVGSGPMKKKLQGMAEKLGVADRVFFLEGLTNLELRIVFWRCLAVVFAPIREPFGIVALEAMAAAKPLIAVDEGGFTEVVDDSCALLVRPFPEAIAEKIRYLRDHKDLARKMGLAGREKAQQFTWDRSADQLLEIIERTYADAKKSQIPTKLRPSNNGPLFGTQYYCWYGNGIGSPHWNDNGEFGGITDTPALGYYSSGEGVTIEEHLKMMGHAGLDFAILNLHVDSQGPNPYELAAIENILNLAEDAHSPLRFAVQICMYNPNRDSLIHVLKIVDKIASRHKQYLTFADKPVLFVFWAGTLDGDSTTIDLLRKHSEQFVRIASSLRMYDHRSEAGNTFGLFDGWSLFSPLELSQSSKWTQLWRKAYDNSLAGTMDIKILTVSPGYDDAHLEASNRKHNPYRVIDRGDGKTYQRMIDFALSVEEPPDMVIVSTFNEYHENTHIEPSHKHGSKYLDATKNFVEAGTKVWKRT